MKTFHITKVKEGVLRESSFMEMVIQLDRVEITQMQLALLIIMLAGHQLRLKGREPIQFHPKLRKGPLDHWREKPLLDRVLEPHQNLCLQAIQKPDNHGQLTGQE